MVSVHVWPLKLSYLHTNQPTLETYPTPLYVYLPIKPTLFLPTSLAKNRVGWTHKYLFIDIQFIYIIFLFIIIIILKFIQGCYYLKFTLLIFGKTFWQKAELKF
jgi:hypothetical protein